MNLRHTQCHGNVLELLALLRGDAAVGEERKIGGADDLLLGFPIEHGRSGGELGKQPSRVLACDTSAISPRVIGLSAWSS